MRRMFMVRWHRIRGYALRWRAAYRYARGTMTEADASSIGVECYHVDGCYPLAYMTVESVLETARDRWGDDPRLEELVRRAVLRVWNKWPGDGGLQSAAEDWAMNLIEDYAAQDGIQLQDSWAEAA